MTDPKDWTPHRVFQSRANVGVYAKLARNPWRIRYGIGIAALVIVWGVFEWATARADGIAESLMPADPCWTMALTADGMADFAIIDEADTMAQVELYADNCIPRPVMAAYVPGHKTMFWRQPDPLPSPVPLPAAGWMMLAGLGTLGVRKWA